MNSNDEAWLEWLHAANEPQKLATLLAESDEKELGEVFRLYGFDDAPLPVDGDTRATLLRVLLGVATSPVKYLVPKEDGISEIVEVRNDGGTVVVEQQMFSIDPETPPGQPRVRRIPPDTPAPHRGGDPDDDDFIEELERELDDEGDGDGEPGGAEPQGGGAGSGAGSASAPPARLPSTYWSGGQPHNPTPPAGGGPIGYHHVNFKVVFWIPHFPNGPMPPFSRIIPNWRGKLNGTQSQMIRGMLATGNTEPPTDFPTAASYAQFFASKEYRGVVDVDIYFCCNAQGQITTGNWRHNTTVGYTPSFSTAAAGDLAGDHQSRETLSSMIEREFQSGTTNAGMAAATLGAITGGVSPIGPRIPRALRLAALRRRHPNTPDSYSPGNGSGTVRTMWGANRVKGLGNIEIQVNDVDNVLYYALTGQLLPYMWGEFALSAGCNGAASLLLRGSAVPSKRVYINNRSVGTWDMMSRSAPEILAALPISTRANPGNANQYLNNPSQVQPRRAPATPNFQVIGTGRINQISAACPSTFPTAWPY